MMNPTPEFVYGDLQRPDWQSRIFGATEDVSGHPDVDNSLYILASHEYEQNGASWA
jgi:hypothetical protein